MRGLRGDEKAASSRVEARKGVWGKGHELLSPNTWEGHQGQLWGLRGRVSPASLRPPVPTLLPCWTENFWGWSWV